MLALVDDRLTLWIRNHAARKDKFRYSSKTQWYYVVDDDFDPDMPVCFGYDEAHDTFFISENIPTTMRMQVLHMECYRLYDCPTHTHLDAVKILLSKPTFAKSARADLTEILRTFYTAFVGHLTDADMSDHAEDARATLRYLKSIS